VATDLHTSEDVVFCDGRVVDAVRASISIPGIMSPVRARGSHLIDGGVTNPLGIDLLHDVGVDKVVAVNVYPSPADILNDTRKPKEDMQEHTWWGTVKMRVYQFMSTNIFNVLMSTVQYLESATAIRQETDADVVIRPIISGASWAEFYNPEPFIECGYQQAKKSIPEIRALLKRRSVSS